MTQQVCFVPEADKLPDSVNSLRFSGAFLFTRQKGFRLEHFAVIPILLFSVIVHEIAHGLMALKLGDPTARDLGRLTLNPIPHIDPIGSILVPLVSYLTAGTVFIAWAKPVPVNPANFQHVRRDDILVSVVGPASNLVVALACTVGYVVLTRMIPVDLMPEGAAREAVFFFSDMMLIGISLNIYLAVFNMIPVPPLDGSHVVASILPPALGEQYRKVGFLGIVLIIVLMRLDAVRTAVLSIIHHVLVPYQLLIEWFNR